MDWLTQHKWWASWTVICGALFASSMFDRVFWLAAIHFGFMCFYARLWQNDYNRRKEQERIVEEAVRLHREKRERIWPNQ